MRIAMRTATTRTFIIRFKITHLLSLASTMANSNEAVKECTGDLYSPNFREGEFPEHRYTEVGTKPDSPGPIGP